MDIHFVLEHNGLVGRQLSVNRWICCSFRACSGFRGPTTGRDDARQTPAGASPGDRSGSPKSVPIPTTARPTDPTTSGSGRSRSPAASTPTATAQRKWPRRKYVWLSSVRKAIPADLSAKLPFHRADQSRASKGGLADPAGRTSWASNNRTSARRGRRAVRKVFKHVLRSRVERRRWPAGLVPGMVVVYHPNLRAKPVFYSISLPPAYARCEVLFRHSQKTVTPKIPTGTTTAVKGCLSIMPACSPSPLPGD